MRKTNIRPAEVFRPCGVVPCQCEDAEVSEIEKWPNSEASPQNEAFDLNPACSAAAPSKSCPPMKKTAEDEEQVQPRSNRLRRKGCANRGSAR